MTDRHDVNKCAQSAAAQWLAENWEAATAQPLTAVLRERYGFDFRTAIKAIAEARRIRGEGAGE